MSNRKTLEVGFLCGGRGSQKSYNSLITMYLYAKENGFSDINVNFIEPELEKYKEIIEEVREYVKECSSREISLDILEILDKVKNV